MAGPPRPRANSRTERKGKKIEGDNGLRIGWIRTGNIRIKLVFKGYGQIFHRPILITKKFAHALMEKIYEIQSTKMELYLKEVGEYLDVVSTGDDLSGQSGPLISLELYRKMIKPYHRKYYKTIKDNTDAKLLMHSYGSAHHFFDDFIEIGVDIVNPVQVSAVGMDPLKLKRKYGDHLVFWGGIDTQNVLPNGSPLEVKEEVHKMIKILGRNGGYVLCAVHNIQPDVPPENIVALYDAAAEYGT